jgi:hypothetical protein
LTITSPSWQYDHGTILDIFHAIGISTVKVHTKHYISAPKITVKIIFVIKNNQTQSEDRNTWSLIQSFRNLSRVRNIWIPNPSIRIRICISFLKKIFDIRIPITPSGTVFYYRLLCLKYSNKVIEYHFLNNNFDYRLNFIAFKYVHTWQYYSETPAVFCYGYPNDPNIPNCSF